MNKQTVLSLQSIGKSFIQGSQNLHVLEGASLELLAGECVALVGQSGSGKSTFLQIAGLLDRPDTGQIIIAGQDMTTANDKERTKVRGKHIGVVYQYHHLLPDFSAIENVMIPQMIIGLNKKTAQEQAKVMLESLGLGARLEHRPAQLSGGEQQRVAIARAMINKPSLLLADEPTGNLDPTTCESVHQLLMQTAATHQIAVLFVTHNIALAKRCERVVELKNGQVV